MIGLIGAGVSTLGSIAGGIMGAASAKKERKMIEGQQKELRTWYDKRYNENSTERADAVSAIERMKEAMASRTKAAQGSAAVMGTSNESGAIEKQSQVNSLGNTISNIAIAGEQRKDGIEQTYLAKNTMLDNQLIDAERRKQEQIGKATEGVSSVGQSLITNGESLLSSLQGKKK